MDTQLQGFAHMEFIGKHELLCVAQLLQVSITHHKTTTSGTIVPDQVEAQP